MVSSSRTLVVIAVIVLGSITLLFQFSGNKILCYSHKTRHFPLCPVYYRWRVAITYPKLQLILNLKLLHTDQLASRLPCPLKQQPWSWYSQCYQDSILWEEIFSKYPRKCYGTFLDVGLF